jgi:hypothetical protein
MLRPKAGIILTGNVAEGSTPTVWS